MWLQFGSYAIPKFPVAFARKLSGIFSELILLTNNGGAMDNADATSLRRAKRLIGHDLTMR
jgi:hypothetical protein